MNLDLSSRTRDGHSPQTPSYSTSRSPAWRKPSILLQVALLCRVVTCSLGAHSAGEHSWGGKHSFAEHSCWAALGEHSGRTRWGEHLLGEHSCLGAVMLGSTCWGSTSARWPSLLQRDSSNHGMTKEIQSHLCLPEFPVPEAKLSTTCRPQPSRPGRQPSALCPHFWWAAAFHTQHAATSKPSSVSIPGQVPSEHP